MSIGRGPKIPLGKILIDQGKITQEQLKQGLALQKTTPEKIGRLLIELGFITERDVQIAFAKQMNMPVFDPARMAPDPSVLKSIPDQMMERHGLVALRRSGNRLLVAMVDPTNVIALDDLRMATGCEVEPVLALSSEVVALRQGRAVMPVMEAQSAAPVTEITPEPIAGSSDNLTSIMESMKPPDSANVSDSPENEATVREGEEAPVIRLVNVILQEAIRQGASDVHIEPDRKNVRVRYRVDGVLFETMTIPRFIHAPLISRLKIMADMNIAERRVPQDGRIHIRHSGRDFDLRVNTVPIIYGEKCVMRILDQSSVLIGLGRLGFMPDMLAELEELVVQPNGMVLATGPTGSGKTTSLYSVLNKINTVEKNILTVEDPVEYQLSGINQVAINRKAGLTFPITMRAFLRQDPDIIMVGEIRDLETAEIAVQASLTGHLVLSTLHTNNAPATIVRLSDMGVEPFLISASVIGIIAQRLGRKLCPKCKQPVSPPLDALLRLGVKEDELEGATFFRAVGCDECRGRGFKGRLGIYELLVMTEEIAELVVRRVPLSEITQAAIANGMTTLLRDGLSKVKSGVTTIEEVLRVVTSH